MTPADQKIFLIGFMGSGKTYWGQLLSQKLGIPFFDMDEQVAQHEGKSIVEIFAENGEEYFRLLEKDVLHIITESHDKFVMACGGGSPCYFKNIDYMNQSGTTVWINTPADVIFKRLINEKEKRPLPEREDRGRGGALALPQLQLVGGGQWEQRETPKRNRLQTAHWLF